MTGRDETDAGELRSALHEALAARDRHTAVPSFESLTASGAGTRSFGWRPALASISAALIVGAGLLLWRSPEQGEAPILDARLVEELSPVSYWRVPTDELLAYAPAPVALDLDIDTGLPVSLEESLL